MTGELLVSIRLLWQDCLHTDENEDLTRFILARIRNANER